MADAVNREARRQAQNCIWVVRNCPIGVCSFLHLHLHLQLHLHLGWSPELYPAALLPWGKQGSLLQLGQGNRHRRQGNTIAEAEAPLIECRVPKCQSAQVGCACSSFPFRTKDEGLGVTENVRCGTETGTGTRTGREKRKKK